MCAWVCVCFSNFVPVSLTVSRHNGRTTITHGPPLCVCVYAFQEPNNIFFVVIVVVFTMRLPHAPNKKLNALAFDVRRNGVKYFEWVARQRRHLSHSPHFPFSIFTAHRFLYLLVFSACATTALVLPTYIFLVLDVFIISVFRWHRYVVNGTFNIGNGISVIPECVCSHGCRHCRCVLWFSRHERNILDSDSLSFFPSLVRFNAQSIWLTRFAHLMFLC